MGKRIPLSNGRRLVNDLIRIAKTYPSAGLFGDFDSGLVAKLRRRTTPKISWNVLYMKAYGVVASEMPELRQAYVRFPLGHIYQHHKPICMMTLNREHLGEERLFLRGLSTPTK